MSRLPINACCCYRKLPKYAFFASFFNTLLLAPLRNKQSRHEWAGGVREPSQWATMGNEIPYPPSSSVSHCLKRLSSLGILSASSPRAQA